MMPTDKQRLDWFPYHKEKWSEQKLPREGKPVLLMCRHVEQSNPEPICVGYLKFAAGDNLSPYFISPGMMGAREEVIAWADVLPEIDVFDFWRSGRDAAMRAEKGKEASK